MKLNDKLGIKASKICNCCKGKRNTTGGFHWKYTEEYVDEEINPKNKTIILG